MNAFGFGIGLGVRQRRGGGAAPAPAASAIAALVVQGAAALDPDGGGIGIDGDGWIAKAVLPHDAGASFDPSKIVLTVADPGFDSDGSAVVRTRTIRGGAVVRRQYPNMTERLAAQIGGTLEVHFSLEEEIYAGSTIVGAVAEAGYHGAAEAGAIGGIVNGSTLAYPKPLFAWLNLQSERATGTHLPVEAVAYHRHAMLGAQVACIEFVARDAQATPNVSAVQRASAPALSGFQTRGQIVEAWKAQVPLAALTQGDLCALSAVVKPWIGEAWDLAAEGQAWPTPSPQTLLRFVCDKDGTYGGAVVCVKAGAAGGAVQATIEAARATPFPTINAAIAALPAWNGANKIGNATHSGSTVYLMDDGAGGDVAHAITSASFNATPAGGCFTEIRVDPAATGAVSLSNVAANRSVPQRLRWIGVDIVATFGLDGGGSGNDWEHAYEDLTVTAAGASIPFNYRNGHCSMRNVTVTGVAGSGGNPFKALSNTRMRLFALGCEMIDAGGNQSIYPYVLIGCDLRRCALIEYDLAATTNAAAQDGAIVANNRMLEVQGAMILASSQDWPTGLAFVQNVLERAAAPDSTPAVSLNEAPRTMGNAIVMHNSIPGVDGGSRFNWLYADDAGSQGLAKRGVARFNLFTEYNVKTDSFVASSAETGRVANWRVRYGVGCAGNVMIAGDSNGGTVADPEGGNWLGEHLGSGSAAGVGIGAVGYASNLSGTAGPGGGDYALTGEINAAYARVPAGMAALAFDLAGLARRGDGGGAAGAYERSG